MVDLSSLISHLISHRNPSFQPTISNKSTTIAKRRKMKKLMMVDGENESESERKRREVRLRDILIEISSSHIYHLPSHLTSYHLIYHLSLLI